jgi:hypothetical protein
LQPNQFQQQIGGAAQQPQRLLQRLLDQFMRASAGQGGLDGQIPPQGLVAPPNPGRCGCAGYAQPGDTIDLAGGQGGQNRADASKIEQLLKVPQVRAQVEAALGGRILDDGAADGVLRIQRQPMGVPNNLPFGPTAQGLNMLDNIDRGAMQAFGPLGPGADPFMGLMAGGLGNALGGGGLFGGGAPLGGGLPIGGGAPLGGGAPVGGGGMFGGGNEIGNIMGDPGMTMEDKVVMLLMKLTKSFDRQIENQANKLQALQNQQQGGGGKGGGGKGGGAGGQPSIDVESMALKRLIDKRAQMFDMLRQVIDKYNQTAKGMIDGMGR